MATGYGPGLGYDEEIPYFGVFPPTTDYDGETSYASAATAYAGTEVEPEPEPEDEVLPGGGVRMFGRWRAVRPGYQEPLRDDGEVVGPPLEDSDEEVLLLL